MRSLTYVEIGAPSMLTELASVTPFTLYSRARSRRIPFLVDDEGGGAVRGDIGKLGQ